METCRFRPPYTIYSVAVLYDGPDGFRRVISRSLLVSGVNPLTLDEVTARARKEIEANWSEGLTGGTSVSRDLSAWGFAMAAMSYVTIE